MANVGLLNGFNHDALHELLAIGDIISLLPDGRNLNGVVSFSSVRGIEAHSSNAWVQVLHDTTQMPQNITDTRFRLVPRLQRKASSVLCCICPSKAVEKQLRAALSGIH